MVKKIAIVLLCTVLGSSLYAKDIFESEKFLGLEIGAATIQADTGGFFPELDHEGTDVEFGIRIGAQTHEWRTMIIFDYFDSEDDDQNYEKGFLSLDYFFLGSETDAASFGPYIGLNVGYMNYESTDIDENGFLYGGQAGFTYRVMDSMDLDLMYRYSLTDVEMADHIGSVVFGINYVY